MEVYREQDGYPEIRLEPVAVLQRRVEFARLRSEGCSVPVAAIMMCMDAFTSRRYEAARLAAAGLYEALSADRLSAAHKGDDH